MPSELTLSSTNYTILAIVLFLAVIALAAISEFIHAKKGPEYKPVRFLPQYRILAVGVALAVVVGAGTAFVGFNKSDNNSVTTQVWVNKNYNIQLSVADADLLSKTLSDGSAVNVNVNGRTIALRLKSVDSRHKQLVQELVVPVQQRR